MMNTKYSNPSLIFSLEAQEDLWFERASRFLAVKESKVSLTWRPEIGFRVDVCRGEELWERAIVVEVQGDEMTVEFDRDNSRENVSILNASPLFSRTAARARFPRFGGQELDATLLLRGGENYEGNSPASPSPLTSLLRSCTGFVSSNSSSSIHVILQMVSAFLALEDTYLGFLKDFVVALQTALKASSTLNVTEDQIQGLGNHLEMLMYRSGLYTHVEIANVLEKMFLDLRCSQLQGSILEHKISSCKALLIGKC